MHLPWNQKTNPQVLWHQCKQAQISANNPWNPLALQLKCITAQHTILPRTLKKHSATTVPKNSPYISVMFFLPHFSPAWWMRNSCLSSQQIRSARKTQELPYSGTLASKEYLSLNAMIHPELPMNLNPRHFPWEHALHSQRICFDKHIRGSPPSLLAANCPNHAGRSKKEMRADRAALLVQPSNYKVFQVWKEATKSVESSSQSRNTQSVQDKISPLNRNNSN